MKIYLYLDLTQYGASSRLPRWGFTQGRHLFSENQQR